jgi:hypothetical protein
MGSKLLDREKRMGKIKIMKKKEELKWIKQLRSLNILEVSLTPDGLEISSTPQDFHGDINAAYFSKEDLNELIKELEMLRDKTPSRNEIQRHSNYEMELSYQNEKLMEIQNVNQ